MWSCATCNLSRKRVARSLALYASISSDGQPIVLGPSCTGAGKTPFAIQRANVVRLVTIPRAFKSANLRYVVIVWLPNSAVRRHWRMAMYRELLDGIRDLCPGRNPRLYEGGFVTWTVRVE